MPYMFCDKTTVITAIVCNQSFLETDFPLTILAASEYLLVIQNTLSDAVVIRTVPNLARHIFDFKIFTHCTYLLCILYKNFERKSLCTRKILYFYKTVQ